MLPSFPTFKPIEVTDRPAIESVTRRLEPSSDFNAGSLWCWNVDGSFRISILNQNLVVRFKNYLTNDYFYSFIGDHQVVETARALLARSRKEGLEPRLRLISESVVTAGDWPADEFMIVEDPSNFDYVLSIREWAALSGRRFAGHRAKANKVARQSRLDVRPLDLSCRATKRAMFELFDVWAEGRPEDPGARRSERTALERLLLFGDPVAVSGCGVFDAGAMCAFTLWEGAPGGRFSNHHFMKTDWSHPGISSLLIHLRSRLLLDAGYEFANIEQDLGIPGLITFKRSLQPCRYLRKFVISDEGGA